jgi:tripartite-type tricarboxylate transporter receptor subunit TctC
MLTRRVLAAGLLSGSARAQPAAPVGFPDRPVRLLLGFPPGGTVDTIGRLVGPPLAARLGQPVVLENRSGAAGVLAVEAAAHARADGHTLVLASAAALAVIPHMQPNLPYDPFRDLAPVSRVVATPHLLVVGKDVPARSVAELVAAARAAPGRLTFGSTGNGSTLHLAGELFGLRAGAQLLHVPYRGGAPAVTALLAGEIDMLLTDIPVVMPHVQSGAVRALGLAAGQRIAALPDVPTIAEAGIPGVVAEGWYALFAPAGTPAEAIGFLAGATAAALALPETRRGLEALGGVVEASAPAVLAAYLRAEWVKWGEVVRVSGARMN